MEIYRPASRLNWNFLGTALILAVIGCVLVYSATFMATDAPLSRKQIIWTSIGIILMIVFATVDYHLWFDVAPFFYGIFLVLLLYLLVWERFTRNVKSWVHIGSFQFQPSEFMKIFAALLLAKYFDSNDRAYLNLRSFLAVMLIVMPPVILIALQPALGSAATFFPLIAVAMFFGGIRARVWIAAILVVLLMAPLGFFFFLKPFQRERVVTFLDPERDPLGSGYQVMQAKIATGSGGITGEGFLQGTQVNLQYLPARHTDFIFSVLGEEWGFVGVVIVLTLFLFLIVEALSIAKSARDRGGTFLVLGLISFFIFHVLINVSMQIGLFPVTGIPLPLISYGGSATMMFFIAIGLILNVDYRKFVNR
jgi:rod shape determining protein RodA